MAHDVFISYSSKDKTVADAACARLEGAGVRCWIAPRDVRPGMQYGSELTEALERTKVLVLILSSNANYSKHVSREVEQAVHLGVYVLPFRIEEVKPSAELRFFISSVHWLDALTPHLELHLEQLCSSVARILGPDDGGVAAAPSARQQPVPAAVGGAPARGKRTLVVAAGVAAIALGGAYALFKPAGDVPSVGGPAVGSADGAPLAVPGQSDPSGGSSKAALPAPTSGKPANSGATPSTPGASRRAAPSIVGCWRYPTGGVLRVTDDGSVQGGPLSGRWESMEEGRYMITWPTFTDRLQLSSDGRKVSGVNNFGLPVGATRSGPPAIEMGSLVGSWRYNNIPTVVSEDGSLIAGPYKAKWRATGSGSFVVDWEHRPVDDVGLSGGGNMLIGSNNFGATISAARATCGA